MEIVGADTPQVALVVTTINGPNAVLKELAAGCGRQDWRFFVIGDKKGPREFACDGAEFYSLQRQIETDFAYARFCPTGHYARKNVGYLLAVAGGSNVIVETDDDNMPLPSFWAPRARLTNAARYRGSGWVNIYRYFTDATIWPRGLPLDAVHGESAAHASLAQEWVDVPIQQGLANDNPDVDAVYRLIMPLPQTFRADRAIALGSGAWCPFNSQNTSWWLEAFPLLYLPAYCSFRMTDIWRSFVAQRVAWECGWSILFHGPTMAQDRNEHDLMKDFADEVPGYLNNQKIKKLLDEVELMPGASAISENMLRCYRVLSANELVSAEEVPLLQSWLNDLETATRLGSAQRILQA
jgi:hypothetical protein